MKKACHKNVVKVGSKSSMNFAKCPLPIQSDVPTFLKQGDTCRTLDNFQHEHWSIKLSPHHVFSHQFYYVLSKLIFDDDIVLLQYSLFSSFHKVLSRCFKLPILLFGKVNLQGGLLSRVALCHTNPLDFELIKHCSLNSSQTG